MNDPTKGTELLEFLHSRQSEQIELLRRLVEFETPSDRKDLVDRFVDDLVGLYEETGAAARVIPAARAGNLCLVELPGQGKPVLILGHTDTVYAEGTLARQPFQVADGRISGPGVFDMKAGIAVTLELCRARQQQLWHPKRPIWILWTSDEEVGSQIGRPHLEALARPTEAVLVLEPPLPGGRAKTGRKGVGEFELKVFGRSAHAGIAPEEGINAIEELAHQIVRLQKMSNRQQGAQVTVGMARGGTRTNVVPAEAQATIDFRFATAEVGRRLVTEISRLEPVLKGARLEITGGINRPPLERTPAVVELFGKAQQAAAELGWRLDEGSTGGGSDGSFTAALGIPTLDGLGIDGHGAHAVDEHILLEDFPRKAATLGRLIENL